MDNATNLRWTLLIAALTGTLVAMFYPTDDAPEPSRRKAGSAGYKKPTPGISLVASMPANDDDFTGDPDPFAPRGWLAPPPAPPPAPASVAVAAETSPTPIQPAGAPPLPYRFVGSMSDGAEQLVYLGQGDEAVVAHAGDVLENTYKVTSITASQIEFEHLPTGRKQALNFPVRDN